MGKPMNKEEALERLMQNFFLNSDGGYEWSWIPGHSLKKEDPKLNAFLKETFKGLVSK